MRASVFCFITSSVLALQGLLELGHGGLDGGLVLGAHLVAVVLEGLLGRVDEAVGLVAGLGPLALALVLLGVGLGFLDHLVDLGRR